MVRRASRFAVAGTIVYVGVDVLLRFLRPGYSLLYNAESDYGRGSWYWVMDLNFLLRCAVSVAAVAAVARASRPDDRSRVGLTMIVIWAACSGLLAFVADNPAGQPVTASGIVHLVLAFIAFVCVASGTILVSAGLRSDPSWRPTATVLLAVAMAGAAALLLLATATGHKAAPGGLYERIFLGLQLGWIALAAGYAASRGATRRPAAYLAAGSLPGARTSSRAADGSASDQAAADHG